nr:F-box domain, leucine-rich repeat domain, L domain-like protein [Tanacetum cinerariifolium]
TQFDLRPHMESPDWTEINAGIQQYLQKAYNTNKAAFKAQHWVIDPTTGTYNVEKIRREHADLNHSGEEMRRLEAMGTYTDDEINHLARGGKQRGHIAGVGRVLPARAIASPSDDPSGLA